MRRSVEETQAAIPRIFSREVHAVADKASVEEKRPMAGTTVLIVDDSSVMRKIVERALRQSGLNLTQVLEAGNGAEAIQALEQARVDLIISDINMPSMNGLEFLREMQSRALAPGVPVVMITTESGAEHVREALAAGAQGYIRKPFTPDQVRERVLPLLTAV
jgi:two-component system, chemotaxis family, chemotaxis protein CheY